MKTLQGSATWEKIAQGWALRPREGSRPTVENIQDYRKIIDPIIRKKKIVQAVIFGSTPEVRDLLAEYSNVEVTAVDINPEMTLALTSLMSHKTPREVWVKADWRTVPLQHRYYDLAFGDFIKGQLPFLEQPALYRHIRELLKPTGYLIERIFSTFPQTTIWDVKTVIEKFSRIKPTPSSGERLWCYLVFLTHTDPKEYTTERSFRILRQYQRYPYVNQYIELLRKLFGEGKRSWHHGRPWEEDKAPVMKYFTIAGQYPDRSMYSDSSYIFKLKPKQ